MYSRGDGASATDDGRGCGPGVGVDGRGHGWDGVGADGAVPPRPLGRLVVVTDVVERRLRGVAPVAVPGRSTIRLPGERGAQERP